MSLEVVAAALVLAAGIALTLPRPPARRDLVLRAGIWVAGAVLIWATAGRVWEPRARALLPPATRPIEVVEPDHTSSRACRACHPEQYDSWADSYHRSMTQLATPDAIRAPFVAHEWSDRGQVFRVLPRGSELWVEQDAPLRPGARARREQKPVVLVTGSHHVQVFWLPSQSSRKLEMFGLAWRIAEGRWVPVDAIFLTPPDLHQLSTAEGRWNVACVRCHATDGRPRISGRHVRKGLVDAEMDTQVGEFGIACESCHGGAAEHVRRNRNPLVRLARHFADAEDDTIVNPARLDAAGQNRVCGQCHSVFGIFPDRADEWSREGFQYRPGEPLEENRLMGPDAGSTWPDGVMRTGGREYRGVVEGPCFVHGDAERQLSCLSCHELHQPADDPRPRRDWADDQLRADRLDDHACLTCHAELAGDPARTEHTHHRADSSGSRCMNCHMPNTAYGLLKLTRNHAIESPSVATELATGRPNACNLCHLDRPLAWTAEHLAAWTGAAQPALEPEQTQVADSLLWLLRGDANQRAIAAWHMGWEPALEASGATPSGSGLDWMVPSLAEGLVDPYAAVRFVAERALRARPPLRDLVYDYVGPEAGRDAARRAVLEAWADEGSPPDTGLAALLLEPDGGLREAERRQLLAERDRRRVALEE